MAAMMWRQQCAVFRYFGLKYSKILNNSSDFVKKNTPKVPKQIPSFTRLYSNYAKSPFAEKVNQYKYEILKNPEAWQCVQRLMPLETIPEVIKKEKYSSGWKPSKEIKDLPFFIARTKNHMIPVYLKLTHRGASKLTQIKRIEGDIWLLNDEIKSYLKEKHEILIETRVHELARSIEVKGDFVVDVVDWAYSLGF